MLGALEIAEDLPCLDNAFTTRTGAHQGLEGWVIMPLMSVLKSMNVTMFIFLTRTFMVFITFLN